jgi:hypothetical protein
MNVDIQALQSSLCNTFCSDVRVAVSDEKISVSLPMSARDGDRMTAYLSQIAGGWRVSDMGTTMMRLSYENDLGRLLAGARGQLFETILKENGLSEDDGELYLDVSADALTRGLFTLGQGLTRVEDIGLWTRNRIESTFYEDLRDLLCEFLPADKMEEGYIVPGLPSAESYPVDYLIRTGGRPLYLFGVNGKDKAMLTTIILQHLQQSSHSFESMVVCSNIDEIPKQDRRRLMNAANDVIPYIQDAPAIRKKIEHRMLG